MPATTQTVAGRGDSRPGIAAACFSKKILAFLSEFAILTNR
jgi:hypothetical protein